MHDGAGSDDMEDAAPPGDRTGGGGGGGELVLAGVPPHPSGSSPPLPPHSFGGPKGRKKGPKEGSSRIHWDKPVNAALGCMTFVECLEQAMRDIGLREDDLNGTKTVVGRLLPLVRQLINEAGGDGSSLSYKCLLNKITRIQKNWEKSLHSAAAAAGQRVVDAGCSAATESVGGGGGGKGQVGSASLPTSPANAALAAVAAPGARQSVDGNLKPPAAAVAQAALPISKPSIEWPAHPDFPSNANILKQGSPNGSPSISVPHPQGGSGRHPPPGLPPPLPLLPRVLVSPHLLPASATPTPGGSAHCSGGLQAVASGAGSQSVEPDTAAEDTVAENSAAEDTAAVAGRGAPVAIDAVATAAVTKMEADAVAWRGELVADVGSGVTLQAPDTCDWRKKAGRPAKRRLESPPVAGMTCPPTPAPQLPSPAPAPQLPSPAPAPQLPSPAPAPQLPSPAPAPPAPAQRAAATASGESAFLELRQAGSEDATRVMEEYGMYDSSLLGVAAALAALDPRFPRALVDHATNEAAAAQAEAVEAAARLRAAKLRFKATCEVVVDCVTALEESSSAARPAPRSAAPMGRPHAAAAACEITAAAMLPLQAELRVHDAVMTSMAQAAQHMAAAAARAAAALALADRLEAGCPEVGSSTSASSPLALMLGGSEAVLSDLPDLANWAVSFMARLPPDEGCEAVAAAAAEGYPLKEYVLRLYGPQRRLMGTGLRLRDMAALRLAHQVMEFMSRVQQAPGL